MVNIKSVEEEDVIKAEVGSICVSCWDTEMPIANQLDGYGPTLSYWDSCPTLGLAQQRFSINLQAFLFHSWVIFKASTHQRFQVFAQELDNVWSFSPSRSEGTAPAIFWWNYKPSDCFCSSALLPLGSNTVTHKPLILFIQMCFRQNALVMYLH